MVLLLYHEILNSDLRGSVYEGKTDGEMYLICT